MNMKHSFLSLLCLISIYLFADLALSADPPMMTRGVADRLIVENAFDQDHPKVHKQRLLTWNAAIGQWWIADGALHGDELTEDKHASSFSHATVATDMVITAQFRLGEAQHIAFGCRDNIKPHHHLARTFISRDVIWITHMSGIAKTTQSEKIAELNTPLDPEAWYTITIEIIGDHYLARINDHVIETQHARFKNEKGLVALITKGQGAQFKNVAIWHAKPKG